MATSALLHTVTVSYILSLKLCFPSFHLFLIRCNYLFRYLSMQITYFTVVVITPATMYVQQRRLLHSHSVSVIGNTVPMMPYQVCILSASAVPSWSNEFWEGNEARVNFLGGYTRLRVWVGNAVWILEGTQLCGGYT